jgi:hypothetical protein
MCLFSGQWSALTAKPSGRRSISAAPAETLPLTLLTRASFALTDDEESQPGNQTKQENNADHLWPLDDDRVRRALVHAVTLTTLALSFGGRFAGLSEQSQRKTVGPFVG